MFPGEHENAFKGRVQSRLFFATAFPEVVAADDWPLFSFSSRVLSIREPFPLDADLTGDCFFDEDPCSTMAFFLGDLGSPAAPVN